MTISMIITLAIVVLMIAVIISDKLPFGAPALIACALLVVCKQADIATAFVGFTDKNVIMIMGFMVCTAALQKTVAIHKLKGVLGRIAGKGGMRSLRYIRRFLPERLPATLSISPISKSLGSFPGQSPRMMLSTPSSMDRQTQNGRKRTFGCPCSRTLDITMI